MVFEPEIYHLKSNKFCPNNDRPVLIYRDCLPLPLSEAKTTEFLESHAWSKKGTWGHISVRHYHPNTHECYGRPHYYLPTTSFPRLCKLWVCATVTWIPNFPLQVSSKANRPFS